MGDDWRLLRRYVEHDSQEAFAALTARYLGLVYSVCRRELDTDEAAEDAAQAVFLILARKAPSLRRGVVLSGWLFQTARFTAKNARTRERRRAAYEQKAVEMQPQVGPEDAAWAEIEPFLNRALAALPSADRESVLLRFFQGLTFAEAGQALGLSEEATRKRVTRALEKMRRLFRKEGLTVAGVALAALLSAHAARAVPAHLAAELTKTLAGTIPAPVSLITQGAAHAMKLFKLKAAAGAAALAVTGAVTYGVATGITKAKTTARSVNALLASPPPGHVLTQTPGKTLTAAGIAARCRAAYGALQSYQGTTAGFDQAMIGPSNMFTENHTSANIRFVRPNKIRVEGVDSSGNPFAYVSDGVSSSEKYLAGNVWRKTQGADMSVGGLAGVTSHSATTIPSLLLALANPLDPSRTFTSEVREDDVGGHRCYVVATTRTRATASANTTQSSSLWIDEHTFLLRRSVINSSGTVLGESIRSRLDQQFTNERLNAPVPDGTFASPASQ